MNSINTISHYPDQNVQFKGLNFSRYAKLEERRMVARMSSGILSQDVNNLMELTRHATVRKLNFFRTLTNKYNKENYYRALDQKEDASLVTKIYQAVKSPNENQRAFAREFNGSMENLYKIFQNIQNKTKRLNFAHTINKDILSEQQGSGRLISDLLESENSAEYIKNYTKYRSYLKLNVNDPDAVKNLDKMIKEGTYNPEKYNAIFKTQEIKLKYAYPETENFNHKIFAENYTEEGNILLKFMSFHSYLPKEAFLDGGDKAVLGLFKTANKNNLPLRLELIKNDSNSVFLDKKLSPEVQIKEFKKLFDKIDSDKNVKKFVEDITKKPARILSVAEINHILDNVPALKLNIFSSNAQNIIFQLRDEKEELVKTLLNEIENPFFETRYARINRKHAEKYGVAKKQSFAQKIMQRFIININTKSTTAVAISASL